MCKTQNVFWGKRSMTECSCIWRQRNWSDTGLYYLSFLYHTVCKKTMIYHKLKWHILPSFLFLKPTEVLLLVQGLHQTGNIGPIAFVVLLSAWTTFGRSWARKQQGYHCGTVYGVCCCLTVTTWLKESSLSSGSRAIALRGLQMGFVFRYV